VISTPLFPLFEVHFHVPGEHGLSDQMQGDARTTYPMEAHFVHGNAGQAQSVLAITFREGAENRFLAQLIALGLPERGQTNRGPGTLDIRDLLPPNSTVYRYVGSLTTPPCAEGLLWHVATATMTASPEQIRTFRERLGHPNNRERQTYRPTGLVGSLELGPR
jgi:carbonic anhydrase